MKTEKIAKKEAVKKKGKTKKYRFMDSKYKEKGGKLQNVP